MLLGSRNCEGCNCYEKLEGCMRNCWKGPSKGLKLDSGLWVNWEGNNYLFTSSAHIWEDKVRKLTISTATGLAYNLRAELVHWVSECKRPFKIVKDWGFRILMKTRRPLYCLPSAQTVSRDVKQVFKTVCQHIAKMLRVRQLIYPFYCRLIPADLQEHSSTINFATDAWTSPNSRAYVAMTAHFEHKGAPISFLLDIVEQWGQAVTFRSKSCSHICWDPRRIWHNK